MRTTGGVCYHGSRAPRQCHTGLKAAAAGTWLRAHRLTGGQAPGADVQHRSWGVEEKLGKTTCGQETITVRCQQVPSISQVHLVLLQLLIHSQFNPPSQSPYSLLSPSSLTPFEAGGLLQQAVLKQQPGILPWKLWLILMQPEYPHNNIGDENARSQSTAGASFQE